MASHIKAGDGTGGDCRITVTVESTHGTVTVGSNLPRESSVRTLLAQAGTNRPLAPTAPARRDLSTALLAPEVRRLLTEEYRKFRRPLRLRLDVPAGDAHSRIRAVPWELGFLEQWDGTGFAGVPVELARHASVHLVREVETGDDPDGEPRELHGPVVIASAYGVGGSLDGKELAPLTLGPYSDVDGIRDELHRTVLMPRVIRPARRRKGVSEPELRGALADGAAGFYFTGHHGPGGLVLAGDDRNGDRRPEWLAAEDLADLLLEAGVGVAVLMACHTATVDGDRAARIGDHRAYAEELAAAGVPWVVSAQGEITSGASLRFAPAFFRNLAYGAAVDEAAGEGCREMGDQAGLIVVHCSRAGNDPFVRAPRAVSSRLAHRVPPRITGEGPADRTARGRDPRGLVNPDVLWGLDRGPIRGIFAAGDGADLAARLDQAEEVVRQGAFDAGRRDLPRRGWFRVDGFAAPAAGIDALYRLVQNREGWRGCLDADSDGAGLGFVVTWFAAEGEEERIAEHLIGIHVLRPAAATVVQVSGSPGDDVRRSLALARQLPYTPDVLAAAVPSVDVDSRLDRLIDDLVDAGRAVRAADLTGEDADAVALAALRRREDLGWRVVWSLLERGTSEQVKAVAAFLRDDSAASCSHLEFMCRSRPEVVAVAWRAGVRPEFAPARLPRDAARMPGCWALLARSRLTPDIVFWLHELGPPLASITGLLLVRRPDHGYEAWLPQLRAAYRPAPLGY
ncbi:CHAT domain-containing protein [Actinomadura sp. 9N407]|uniref:CHAT domain-containing protein n=1 Tax=Actinomadura sp. 9N407 TaxID=3375154 RepID=UPI0037B9D4EE